MTAESSFAGKFLKKLKKIDTEQIEAFLAQVLREKAFLEVVFDSLTEGVIVTEQGMRVVFINEAARTMLGLTRVECHGRDLNRLMKAEVLRRLVEEFQESLEPIRQREITLRTPSAKTYLVTIVPIENEQSLTTHSVWIFSDRTDAARMAEEKQQMGNMESLAALTAGVAHEVKNPLNSLGIHAQLIGKAAAEMREQGHQDPALKRLSHSTGVIMEEIVRLTRIVDDFINAVRPVRPQLRKENPNKVLEAVAELLAPACAERNIEMHLNLDPEIPQLLIDPEQILQAFLNIAKNGMEAIDKPVGRLELRSLMKSEYALLEVQDNGCGIPNEDRMKIFEPYHTTKFSGTGLGLMVVYRIVRAHGGAIGLTSAVGEGTIFSMALPLDERPVRMLPAQVDPELEEGIGERGDDSPEDGFGR